MVKIRTIACAAAGLVIASEILALSEAYAQAPSAIPRREELQQPQQQLRDRQRAGETVGEQVTEEQRPQALTPDETVSFRLNELQIAGLTVYSQGDLEDIYEPYIDTQVTLGSLREIADRIERFYSEDGYVATRVIIPPQAIRDGVARLEVFEGKIIHYEVNGEIGPVKKQIARLLDNLLTDKPARWAELERYLLLARDLPGISLTGTLRSAGDSAPGGVILVVDAARKAVDGFVNFENRNAQPTGPFTISGGASLNSNTEVAERIGAVALLAVEVPEQVSGFATYEQSIGNDGMVVRLNATQGFSEPKDELEDLRLSTMTTVASLELEYPVVRSRDISVWTRGGFEYVNQRTVIGTPSDELFHDQYSALFAGVPGGLSPPVQRDRRVRRGIPQGAWLHR